jgi:apolipoprotein N-acyltransferase
LAWVGLVPLLVALDGKRPVAAFVLSFTSGLIFFPGIFHWALSIKDYNLLDHLLLAVYLSCYLGLFGLALAWIRTRTDLPLVLVAPPLWVAAEYLRAHASFLTFPWLLLGYSQYLHPSLVQITSLTGVYGLSFLIVLTNALGADAVRYWRRSRGLPGTVSFFPRSLVASAVIVSVVVIAVYVHGRVVLSHPLPGERIRIAVVQGNVPQQGVGRAAALDRYSLLTRQAVQTAPVLVVWPETAVPSDLKHDPTLKRKIDGLALETQKFLLVGGSQYAKFSRGDPQNPALQGKFYNTMFLVSPTGTIEGEYRKIILVPFGEYEPLKGIITWPRVFAAGFGNMLPGDSYTLFSIDGRRFGAVICWEAMFPDLFREFVRRGATFMISATNESWFGPTAAPYQLLAMTAIRAAENRTAIARAASTGLSAFIDPYGRIADRVRDGAGRELFVEGVLSHDVPVSRTRTFYSRYGDVFAFLQIGLSATLLARGWRPRKAAAVSTRPVEST